MVAIWAEEDARGIPRSEPDFRMKVLEARWQELKKLASVSKPAAPVPTATPAPKVFLPELPKPAAPVVEQPKLTGAALARAAIRADVAISDLKTVLPVHRAAPSPTLGATVTRAQLSAIVKIAQPSAADFPGHWTTEECRIETERACFQSHLSFPFMRSDAELSNEYWRSDAASITGAKRYLRAEAKSKIEKILLSTKQ